MRKDKTLAALGVGLIALLALSGSSSAEERAQTDEPQPPRDPAKPPELPELVDPLPSFPLSQSTIVEAVTEALESRKTDKLKSVVVKAKSAGLPIRAYLMATLEAVPSRLREDAAFLADFAAYEAQRLDRQKDETDLTRYQSLTRALQVGIASLIPLGKALLEASDLLFGYIERKVIDGGADARKARNPADQILPGYEGRQLRRGVSLQAGPDVPNLTRGDQLRREAIASQWTAEASTDPLFAALPEVPDGTAFRYSPTWGEYKQAAQKLG